MRSENLEIPGLTVNCVVSTWYTCIPGTVKGKAF